MWRRRLVQTVSVYAALACLNWCAVAEAGPYVALGQADWSALDLPRVSLAVYDPNGDGNSLGPELPNEFLLRSGVQGLVAAGLSVDNLATKGYKTVALYDEMGMGGVPHTYYVSLPYNLYLSGTEANKPAALPLVRMLSDANTTFGGYSGILGTPAMLRRVTTLDNVEMASVYRMGVRFEPNTPPGAGHRYDVPLQLLSLPPTGMHDANLPPPTYGPLLEAPVVLGQGTVAEANWFVLDTGIAVSILSTAVAFRLGLDANGDGSLLDEAVSLVPVGSGWAPIMEIDSFALSTRQGVDLVWSHPRVLVLDVDPNIPGLIGMDLLTSGWAGKVQDGNEINGYVGYVHLDLTDPNSGQGTMYLDINPGLDVVVPEPAAVAALLLGGAWIQRRRSRRQSNRRQCSRAHGFLPSPGIQGMVGSLF